MKDEHAKLIQGRYTARRCFQCQKLMRLILRYTRRISANQEIEMPTERQVKGRNREHKS